MRILTLILLAGMTALLPGCGLFGSGQAEVSKAFSRESSISYDGPSSLEARILASPVIARVRLDSATSTVEPGTTYRGLKYLATLEFSFSVLEYLKGSGADDIVAVWAAPFFNTRAEAEDALPAIAAARDAQWDDREAIIFLQHSAAYLPSTQQAGRFFFSGEHLVGGVPDDYYSLASRGNRLWLPTEAAVGAPSQPAGDLQRFLMDVPPATGTAPTITLGELKTRIAAVTAKLNAGDGSEEYRECLERTYYYEGMDRYSIETGGDGLFYRTPDQELESGVAAFSVVYETIAYGGLPNQRAEVWLDGGDADLFSVEFSDGVPHDFSGDGTTDSITYAQQVVSARPLPAGVYRTHYNNRDAHFVPCDGYTTKYEWTVTVTAPEGTLHELFFDPVTVGSAVAADGGNGVLKPSAFTGAGGAAAAVRRIAWESGTVKVEVTPTSALANRVVDFIELDGSVSLTLDVADAAGVGTGTLRWSAASRPWEDGDMLMVRIREPLSCERAVPDAAANPGLLADCKALALAKDVLRGTAELDWSADIPIGQWEGVTVGGTPKRVQVLDLEEKGLTGTLPAELGQLTGLVNFDLSENTLRGPIPTSFGGLTNLRSLTIEYNQLDGAIPAELAQLTQLTNLSLTGNRLTGAVSAWLGNLTRLTGLDLAENRLTGRIPVELGRLSALGYLSLGGNDLSGAVPTQLGQLTALRVLYLDGNDLTGGIPAELGKIASLEVLSLSNNELTGTIPGALGSLINLEEMGLRNNNLTGGIPAALGSLSNLEYLYLAGNTLTGCIPAGLRSVANNDLSGLNLSYCAG